jgi:hypothetical protein
VYKNYGKRVCVNDKWELTNKLQKNATKWGKKFPVTMVTKVTNVPIILASMVTNVTNILLVGLANAPQVFGTALQKCRAFCSALIILVVLLHVMYAVTY